MRTQPKWGIPHVYLIWIWGTVAVCIKMTGACHQERFLRLHLGGVGDPRVYGSVPVNGKNFVYHMFKFAVFDINQHIITVL